MSSPIVPAGPNWSREASRLSAAGYAMPHNPVMARIEARKVADAVGTSGSLTDLANRKMAADMNRRRLAATARGSSAAMTRTAADLQLAMPKQRLPLGTLMDKGIPFNTQDPKELAEARRWARLFYATHDLVPLLVDIYSKFPVTGLEFQCKDPLIEDFYSQMFLNDLDYEDFLPNQLLREYFVAGEVTSLAHFNEQLGVWSSEEILNPDMVAVSKSLFIEQERVQLLVKDLVDTLRQGPGGKPDMDERPSERLERNWEYQQLARYYPEIISAAARDDGLDISDALVSRLVNKASPWDLRGTPILLRSFRTLLMEESLNAAQDAVADRLYAPMVLATMGIENMGNDEPWIPNRGELDDLRDELQAALAADFKLLVHNFGVEVTSVFGRESVPRFDTDYDRIDAKIMQAWGIGQALIMGGTGAGGTYASSAINREVCEQLMMDAQKKVVRHMRKRMELIAEAQEHYDYELKGGRRIPLYREIVVEDEETGESYIKRVPKPLIPDVHFATLNLRDEAQERQFYMMLKNAGVPMSDKFLSLNVPLDAEQELEREAKETVDKGLAKAQAFKKLQDICDLQGLPYPPELAAHLQATLNLRAAKAGTIMQEDQQKQLDQQLKQTSPAGQLGLLPGTAPMPGAPGADFMAGGPNAQGGTPQSSPPQASGPSGAPAQDPADADAPDGGGGAASGGGPEPARNRTRPPESDEMRAGAPRAARKKTAAERWAARVHDAHNMRADGPKKGTPRPPNKLSKGPSSQGHLYNVEPDQVEAAVRRREMTARHSTTPLVSQLVEDPHFYAMCNAGGDEGAIRADYPEIRAGRAPESAKLLHDMVAQYEEITGVRPIFD